MNHAVPGAASAFRVARGAGLCALPIVALLAVAGDGKAQPAYVPGDEWVDKDVGRIPVDARPQIRSYLAGLLPPRWLAGDPMPASGGYSVTIYVPPEWQGNPTSAMMGFCPPGGSALWNDIPRIELVPMYKSARRAGAICQR